jgi:hypothetical protein
MAGSSRVPLTFEPDDRWAWLLCQVPKIGGEDISVIQMTNLYSCLPIIFLRGFLSGKLNFGATGYRMVLHISVFPLPVSNSTAPITKDELSSWKVEPRLGGSYNSWCELRTVSGWEVFVTPFRPDKCWPSSCKLSGPLLLADVVDMGLYRFAIVANRKRCQLQAE